MNRFAFELELPVCAVTLSPVSRNQRLCALGQIGSEAIKHEKFQRTPLDAQTRALPVCLVSNILRSMVFDSLLEWSHLSGKVPSALDTPTTTCNPNHPNTNPTPNPIIEQGPRGLSKIGNP